MSKVAWVVLVVVGLVLVLLFALLLIVLSHLVTCTAMDTEE